MANEETAQVAAALTQSILGEFVANGDENAERILATGQPVVAPPLVVSTPAPAAEAEPTPTPEPEPEPEEEAAVLPSLEPTLSEDLQALLEEPDFEEDARAEVAAMFEAGDVDESFDPQTEAKMRALEKRNAFLEAQVVAKSRKGWVEENRRAYPLLATYAPDELNSITATSRRAFAREAAALNAKYTAILKPALEDVARLKEQAKSEAKTEARREASAQWGLPVSEPAASGFPEQDAALEKARRERAPLAERIKILAGMVPRS